MSNAQPSGYVHRNGTDASSHARNRAVKGPGRADPECWEFEVGTWCQVGGKFQPPGWYWGSCLIDL